MLFASSKISRSDAECQQGSRLGYSLAYPRLPTAGRLQVMRVRRMDGHYPVRRSVTSRACMQARRIRVGGSVCP
jgi:hypothetical protein